jgi:plastocyanin
VRRRLFSWSLAPLAASALIAGLAATSANAATVDVSIDDFEFSPTTVSAAPGDTMRFTNNGSAVHHVVAADGSFDSGALGAGETFSVSIGDRPVPFSCARHENMTGTIALQIVGTSTSAPPVTGAATTAPPVAPTATTAAELAFTGSERGSLTYGALIALALGATGLALATRRATPVGATVGADLLPGGDRDRRRSRARKPPAEF